MTREDFVSDAKTVDAVERCFQRITEAARRLGDVMDRRYPAIDWRAIRSLGNVLRHDYEDIIESEIWVMVQRDLETLEAEIERLE